MILNNLLHIVGHFSQPGCHNQSTESEGSKIKVLHVFGRMGMGGAEMLTLELMRNIDRSKYDFNFCTLSGRQGELDAEIVNMGGKIFPTKINFLFPFVFIDLLKNNKFNVVHSHVHLFSGAIVLLAAIAKVKIRVAHFHSSKNDSGIFIIKKIQNKIMKYLIKKYCTHVVAVCNGVMDALWKKEKNNDNRFIIIYNGLVNESEYKKNIDIKRIREEFLLKEDDKLFIHVGRMAKPKNHIRLIHIFKKIFEYDNSSYLIMIGPENIYIKEKINNLITEFNLDKRVIFAGVRTDVPKLLKAADVMLLPSLWEGLPGVVIESCAAGTPVLASDLAGVREISKRLSTVVVCLELDDSDLKWAEKALSLCMKKYKDKKYEKNANDIIGTVFDIKYQCKELCEIWDKSYGI